MAALNPLTRELVFKIVFYGPGLGGKTTTLQHIHAATRPENRGNLVSLATPTDRTLYFDFLPIRVPKIRSMSVRLQLFTVPGQVYYSATRKLVLTGADGIVFVADSQAARGEANQESLEDLNANLADHGRSLSQIPHTFQWNKRDLADVMSADELDRRFNLFSAPSIGTSATTGEGVFAGLENITRLVLEAYRAELPKGDGDLLAVLEADDSGIADAVRGLAESRPKPEGAPRSKRPTTAAQMRAGREEPTLVSGGGPASGAAVPSTEEAPKSVRKVTSATQASAAETSLANGAESAAARTEPEAAIRGFSLVGFVREAEREAAKRVEGKIAEGDPAAALLACDVLLARILASVGGLAGPADAPRDPGVVCLLMGLDGRRYLTVRRGIREARLGAESANAPQLEEALDAYLFCLEAARMRDVVTG